MVVSLLPTFPMGYVRIGSIYYQLGDNYKAKKSWQKASDLQPKNTSLVEYLERMVAKASYQDIEDLYLSNSPSDASLSDSDSELESLNVAAKNKVEKSRDKGVENE